MPKAELKEKYHEVRSSIKSLVLGLSYGMGAKKLSQRLGLTMAQAECYVEQVNRILGRSTKYKGLLRNRIQRCKAFSLPDGFVCKGAEHVTDNNTTTIINWPFQSGGGMILRVLVHFLTKAIKEGTLKAQLVATIHDAVAFLVDENDYDTINKISNMMKETANKVLAAHNGWTIKVGEPSIIRHNDVWCADDDQFVEQFKELLHFKS